jgi:hypothetical protein
MSYTVLYCHVMGSHGYNISLGIGQFFCMYVFRTFYVRAVEPDYDDIRIYDISSITITLYSLVMTTLAYDNAEYSVPFMTL